jgi:glyoxylate reductase
MLRFGESDCSNAAQRAAGRIGEADGLYCMLTDRIDRELLAAAPNLRAVSNMAVGVDNVDLVACTERGIAVGHTPGVLTEATADLAFGLLIAAARRLGEGMDHVRDGRWGEWRPDLLLGQDVHESVIGDRRNGSNWGGSGSSGSRFGMRVVYASPSPKPAVEKGVGCGSVMTLSGVPGGIRPRGHHRGDSMPLRIT